MEGEAEAEATEVVAGEVAEEGGEDEVAGKGEEKSK